MKKINLKCGKFDSNNISPPKSPRFLQETTLDKPLSIYASTIREGGVKVPQTAMALRGPTHPTLIRAFPWTSLLFQGGNTAKTFGMLKTLF
jgi:hypothetical protein